MTSRKPAPCRLSLVFAAESPVAVVLRRGPTEWVEVVKWNTAKDSFEDGQWLHGRIYAERCGLSPNGSLFVYFAAKHGKVRSDEGYEPTFTAVSRPPYLTALAMWPEGSTYGGGGRFINNSTLRLAYGAGRTRTPHDGKTEIFMAPLPKHHPKHPPRPLKIETDLDYYAPDRFFRIEPTGYPESDWTGKDQGSRRIFTRGGVLYALVQNQEQILRDFNSDKPREIVSPEWARVW